MSNAIQNIVLLTIDSLGASRVGCLGYEGETTPNLDEVATDGTLYTSCIAQSSHTLESMPSLLCSKYPSKFDAPPTLPPSFQTVASELSDLGFATAGFHSNPYISRAYGFHRGFDTFDDSLPLARNKVMVFLHRVYNHFRDRPYRRASELNELSLDWLGSQDDRRFLWLHYMDPHGPYLPPAEFQRSHLGKTLSPSRARDLWRMTIDEPNAITDETRETLVSLHDAVIAYMDAEIGAFLNQLDRRGVADETLVAIAADHGELFGEHGLYGHPRRLYEELIHVPLWLRGPTVPSGRRVDSPVENIDLVPTLLHKLGQPIPSEMDGSPLPTTGGSSSGEEQSIAFAEAREESSDAIRYAVRTNKYKLRTQISGSGDIDILELNDISASRPEADDIQETAPEVRDRLLTRLDTRRESRTTTCQANSIDEVVSERLERLGYR